MQPSFFDKKVVRYGLIGLGSLLAIGLLAIGTLFILKNIQPTKTEKTETSHQAMLDEAAASESSGDTDKAIEKYKALLERYKKEGDTTGVADMEAKISQLEKIRASAAAKIEEAKREARQRALDAGAPDPETEPIQ